MVSILYFAWLREQVGTGAESVELPDHVVTGHDLLAFLSQRHSAAAVFSHPALKMALDQQVCPLSADIRAAGEIAFFPPMTGG